MNDKEKKVFEISSMVAAIRADKHERHDSLTLKEESEITEKIKSAQSDIVSLITEGSKECECGNKPHGMVQYTAIKSKPMPYFEVGCLACQDKRSQGFSIESVVSNWNERNFIK